MKELIIEIIEYWGKKIALKTIYGYATKTQKLARKLQRTRWITKELVKRYNEIYGEQLKVENEKL